MIDRDVFEERLFRWLDRELPPREAAEMDAYCRANPDAQARADAERAFDERVKAALLRDAGGVDVVRAALARTKPRGEIKTLRPASRPLAAAAVVLFAFAGFAWFNCIPPFECPYVTALERASIDARAAAPGVAAFEGDPRIAAAVRRLGEGEVAQDTVAVRFCCGAVGARYRVRTGDGAVISVIEGNCGHDSPSCRRKLEIDGCTWWVGDEDGLQVASFRDPKANRLLAVVGPVSREAVIATGRKLLAALR